MCIRDRIGGALAPLLFTSLFAYFDSWIAPACYLFATCAVTLTGLAISPRAARAA